MEKPYNNRAWLMVAPVFALVLFSALLPMMTVVNYSVRFAWTKPVLLERRWLVSRSAQSVHGDRGTLCRAPLRNLTFSLVALLIEIPLGIAIALCLPRSGWAIGPLW